MIWNPHRCSPSPRGRVAEALERDRHLGDPPVVDQLPGRLEERVPGAVAAAAGWAAVAPTGVEDCVTLHAVAIDRQPVGALLIQEGIEHDGHPVVTSRAVAVDAVGSDLRRVVVTRVEREVQVVGVVGDAHFRRFGRRGAFDRVGLDEVGDEGGIPPRRVVEASVDRRWPIDTDRAYRGAPPDGEAGADGTARRLGRRARVVQQQATCHVAGGRWPRGAVRAAIGTAVGMSTIAAVGSVRARVRVRDLSSRRHGRRRRGDCRPDVRGESILKVEQTGQRTIDLERVHRRLALHVDESSCQTELVAEPLVAAGQEEICAELTGHREHRALPGIAVSEIAHVGDCRRDQLTPDDGDGPAIEVHGDRFGDRDADPVVRRVLGDVVERNHRDRPVDLGQRGGYHRQPQRERRHTAIEVHSHDRSSILSMTYGTSKRFPVSAPSISRVAPDFRAS